MDERSQNIINMVQKDNTPPADVATQLNISLDDVHRVLVAAQVDWAPKRLPGRPITPLRPGQQLYTERAFHAQLSQATISERVRASLARVRRHLTAQRLYPAHDHAERADERQKRLMQALNLYINDVPVMVICRTTNIRPPRLYQELRARNIPLRQKGDSNATTKDV